MRPCPIATISADMLEGPVLAALQETGANISAAMGYIGPYSG
ncbi:hypothetical protein N9368_01615 [Alphaproteobacteria bacterium]|nr:hypothetical protein [Alphaproteobacteria bacterium]